MPNAFLRLSRRLQATFRREGGGDANVDGTDGGPGSEMENERGRPLDRVYRSAPNVDIAKRRVVEPDEDDQGVPRVDRGRGKAGDSKDGRVSIPNVYKRKGRAVKPDEGPLPPVLPKGRHLRRVATGLQARSPQPQRPMTESVNDALLPITEELPPPVVDGFNGVTFEEWWASFKVESTYDGNGPPRDIPKGRRRNATRPRPVERRNPPDKFASRKNIHGRHGIASSPKSLGTAAFVAKSDRNAKQPIHARLETDRELAARLQAEFKGEGHIEADWETAARLQEELDGERVRPPSLNLSELSYAVYTPLKLSPHEEYYMSGANGLFPPLPSAGAEGSDANDKGSGGTREDAADDDNATGNGEEKLRAIAKPLGRNSTDNAYNGHGITCSSGQLPIPMLRPRASSLPTVSTLPPLPRAPSLTASYSANPSPTQLSEEKETYTLLPPSSPSTPVPLDAQIYYLTNALDMAVRVNRIAHEDVAAARLDQEHMAYLLGDFEPRQGGGETIIRALKSALDTQTNVLQEQELQIRELKSALDYANKFISVSYRRTFDLWQWLEGLKRAQSRREERRREWSDESERLRNGNGSGDGRLRGAEGRLDGRMPEGWTWEGFGEAQGIDPPLLNESFRLEPAPKHLSKEERAAKTQERQNRVGELMEAMRLGRMGEYLVEGGSIAGAPFEEGDVVEIVPKTDLKRILELTGDNMRAMVLGVEQMKTFVQEMKVVRNRRQTLEPEML